MKKCPYCAEQIQNDACKCRFCGKNLESSSPLTPPSVLVKQGSNFSKFLFIGLILFFSLGIISFFFQNSKHDDVGVAEFSTSTIVNTDNFIPRDEAQLETLNIALKEQQDAIDKDYDEKIKAGEEEANKMIQYYKDHAAGWTEEMQKQKKAELNAQYDELDKLDTAKVMADSLYRHKMVKLAQSIGGYYDETTKYVISDPKKIQEALRLGDELMNN